VRSHGVGWVRALALLALLSAGSASANTIVLPSPSEPDLLGGGGILDRLYGLANLTRIDDSVDQLWQNTSSQVLTAEAKFAALDQEFGYLPGSSGGMFMPLFSVHNDCADAAMLGAPPCTASAVLSMADSGPVFRFADKAGGIVWRSLESGNPHTGSSFFEDHMVSFLITGGPSAGHYLIAFEDLPFYDSKGHSVSDRDYNDLVVEVALSPVIPEPGTVSLLGPALLGTVGYLRRRRAR
jgi:hypothetical protein